MLDANYKDILYHIDLIFVGFFIEVKNTGSRIYLQCCYLQCALLQHWPLEPAVAHYGYDSSDPFWESAYQQQTT